MDYTRKNRTITRLPENDKDKGESKTYTSINQAKKASRELQSQGHKVSVER